MKYANSVNFKNFSVDNLITKGATQVPMPLGMGTAREIKIEYKYSDDSVSRMVIEGPVLKTNKGIVAPKIYPGADVSNAKPSIPVIFDLSKDDQMQFVGSFGNQYDYVENDDGRIAQTHTHPKPSTGILGQMYDWCIEQYASMLANDKGKKRTSGSNYIEACKDIRQDFFFHQRRYTENDEKLGKGIKGEIIPDSNPMKFFKLMTYKSGTPEANSAKFYLPDGTRVKNENLYGRSFTFIPFLSFRRIFIGAKIAVTMEITEVVINDFIETVRNISVRSARLVERLMIEDPEQAKIVAEKYRLLQSEDSINTTTSNLSMGCKIDDNSDNESNIILTESTFESKPNFNDNVNRRPKLPSRNNVTSE